MSLLPTSPHFMLRRLADGVYAAFATETAAATGNAGIVDLGNATLVFDTFLTPLAGADLHAAAEALLARPVTHVVLSHYHNDHIRGTQEFTAATVIASARTKQLIATEGEEERRSDAAVLPERLPAWEEQLRAAADPQERRQLAFWVAYGRMILESLPGLRIVLPHRTFEGRLTIEGSRRQVELVELAGHSRSDTIMVLPRDGIAFLADLLFVRLHPYLPDGDPGDWLRSLAEIEQFGVPTLVPGHGPLGGRDDVQRIRAYIAAAQEAAEDLIRRGTGADAPVPVPEAFQSWGFERFFPANVAFLRKRLARKTR